ncbi:MAG: hypothetical protein WBW76_08895 [Candidatus Cybelea sp.]
MASLRVYLTIAVAMLLFLSAASARAQQAASCTSSIRVLFNRYGNAQIPTGSTIWFSSVLEGVQSDAGDLGKTPVRIDVRQSRIAFGLWPYVITMPDSTIMLDPSSREPERWWVGHSSWSVTYAPSQIPEAFYDGAPYAVPATFVPGYSGPVTWTATFTSSRPGITVRWAWSAAVYSRFGVNGWLLVKPLTAPVTQFQNNDAAGTPELFKQYVVPGAMGAGAPSYTGARSETASVSACPSSTPPPPTLTQAATPRSPQRAMILISPFAGTPAFASPISQRIEFGDGSVGKAVARCYATDLCALISYGNGDRLAIYSEGAARCKPYVLYFNRTNGGRTIYGFSRDLERDQSSGALGARCPTTRATRIVMQGGRVELTISKNTDGTLRFNFTAR